MIDRLIALLRGAGVDADDREIADALWLAPHIERSLVGKSAQKAMDEPPPPLPPGDPSKQTSQQDPGAPPGVPPPAAVQLGVSGPPSRRMPWKSAGPSVRVPNAPALPDALDLGRALHPLRMRVRSDRRFELDERATATRIAETGAWIPVLRPARSRWLDLALVVDSARSSAVWDRTFVELRALVERIGAFRNVTTWHLSTDQPDGKARLYPWRGRDATAILKTDIPRDRGEIPDSAGRRLILVVSDCTAPAWHLGNIADLLRDWAARDPVAIVQLLPERLWVRTALRRSPVIDVTSLVAGAPSARLADARGRAIPPGSVPVPVITLGQAPLARFSRLLLGNLEGAAKAVLLGKTGWAKEIVKGAARARLSAAERVQQFDARASRTAQRLARLLSAVPLALPVMRLVAQTMLPEARQHHLAEVFYGGLLREEEPEQGDPEHRAFDFIEGVRDILLGGLTRAEAAGVFDSVSGYVGGRMGQTFDFNAILLDPKSATGAVRDEQWRPFARVAKSVLLRLGGDYADAAERVFGEPVATPPAPSPVASSTQSPVARTPVTQTPVTQTPVTPAPAPAPAETPRGERLKELFWYADRYEELRRTLPVGADRTTKMNVLMDEVRSSSHEFGLTEQDINNTYANGTAGLRVVALACLRGNPRLLSPGVVRDALRAPRTPFEQWTALLAVEEIVLSVDPLSAEPHVAGLLAALDDPKNILNSPDDRSRMGVALAAVREFGQKIGFPNGGTIQDVRVWLSAGGASEGRSGTVAVFGSSESTAWEPFCAELGERLATAGWRLVAGVGDNVGLALINGFRRSGREGFHVYTTRQRREPQLLEQEDTIRRLPTQGDVNAAMSEAADYCIAIGGRAGTREQCLLALKHGLPVLAVTFTGGTAAEMTPPTREQLTRLGVPQSLLGLLEKGESSVKVENVLRALNVVASQAPPRARSPEQKWYDRFPFPSTDRRAALLLDILFDAYGNPAEAGFLARKTGMKVSRISFEQSAHRVWQDILAEAAREGLVSKLLDTVLADGKVGAYYPRLRNVMEAPPFEKPIVDLVDKLRELRTLAAKDPRFEPELVRLEEKAGQLAREIFQHSTPPDAAREGEGSRDAPERESPFGDSGGSESERSTSRRWYEQVPFPWHDPRAARLQEVLAKSNYEPQRAMILGRQTGIQEARINFRQSPHGIWQEMLEQAAREERVSTLLEVVLADETISAYHAELRALMADPASPPEPHDLR